MNKKYWKNESKQSNRKRESKPASRDSASTRRHIRAIPVTALDSGIDFLVNVSSSGTNLTRKIESELARLDSVEKKIRKHKCKTTAVTSNKTSLNNPNQRKLRNILENMLATIEYAPPKMKKYAPYQQRVRYSDLEGADAPKRCVKVKKNTPNPKKIDSFANILINNNRRALRPNFPKTDNIFIKSALKKPTPVPNATRNSILADDLKFAESLRFGKNVDLHFMLEDMKKIVHSPMNNCHQVSNHKVPIEKKTENVKFDSTARNNFKVIVEQPSRNISYIYDSPSLDCMEPKRSVIDKTQWSNEPIRTLKKLSPYGSRPAISSFAKNRQELNSKEMDHGNKVIKEEPKEEEFYSYLRRGNFIISGHMEGDNDDGNRAHISDENIEEIRVGHSLKPKNSELGNKSRKPDDKRVCNQMLEESCLGLNGEVVQGHINIKHSETKTSISDKIDVYNSACDFPTELLEKSILAVENVLNTIDCITNEFSQSSEIKDPLRKEVETLNAMENILVETSVDNYFNKLNKDMYANSKNNNTGMLQDAADGDRISHPKKNSSMVNATLHKASTGSLSVSKPTILCSGDSNSVQAISKISQDSSKIRENSFSTGVSQVDVLFLKPPVKYFQNSEENFPDLMTSRHSILTDKRENHEIPKKHEFVISNEEDDLDPLMMALESLRTRVNAIEEEIVGVSSKMSNLKQHDNGTNGINREELPEHLCSDHSRHKISVREVPLSQTISHSSCRSLATSQSDNNFTLNHSYSITCSSNGSRVSSYRKLVIPPNSSTKLFYRQSDRIFNTVRNCGNGSHSVNYRESVRKKTSKIFPDYYIDRCMKLLGKKFKDFDKLRRQRVFEKNSNDSMKSFTFEEPEPKFDTAQTITTRINDKTTTKNKSFREQTEMLWINNTKENYKVCFRNDHFNNRSETSVESHSKEVNSVAKKKNVYTISRIKSSP